MNPMLDLKLPSATQCDPGGGFEPQTKFRSGMQESGWGLYLVSRIADRWGVTPGDGCCVWFELAY
jgi:hypothetical protein